MFEIRETFVNRTENYKTGVTNWYKCQYPFDKKRIFKNYQKEYGKCESKIYIDVPMGDGTFRTVSCGWVFTKKIKYSDCKEYFIQETWIEYK